ncbi:Chromatin modification-related protein meaf6 [Polyrhizophydium stewartii]|uniref:Chromatin modification-related protein EAF6 n=1 Tax=Polyrhizophydium stewartii TaxID=2732419 RepID=A0ABR4NIZ8_9FUNG|nr:chromatin modification- protein eaf6 [Polyrhizophydium stewartii]
MAMLTEAERELADLIAKKRQLDKSLASIEASIYALEGSYLEETQYGNIVRGFEGYLSSRADRRKSRPTDSDRLFSQSSVTYLKAIEMRQREDMA